MLAKPHIKVVVAIFLGSLLEWYDFSIFIFLFPILVPIFFPHTLPQLATFYGYLTLAISYLIRPLGAIIFGYIGDRILKSKVLILTLLLMSLPSFLIGVLPGFNRIGIAAPVLLALLRIIQGLSVGGELIGAILLTHEVTQPPFRYVYTNLVWMGSGLGMLMGSAVAFFTIQLISNGTLHQEVWRVPFLIGGLLGFVGLYLRYYTNLQRQSTIIVPQQNLLEVLLVSKYEILKIILLFAPIALIYYLCFFYTPTFISQVSSISYQKALIFNLASLIVLQLLPIVIGYYYENLNLKLCKSLSLITISIVVMPMFHAILTENLKLLFFAQFILAICLSFYAGIVMIKIIKEIPSHHRFKILAFGYNVSYALFGNALPLLIIYAAMKLNYILLIGIAIIGVIYVSWFATAWFERQRTLIHN